MHIITFVTLIFLPGTFIAVRLLQLLFASHRRPLTSSLQTFFQSGVFQWNQVDGGGTWFFKIDAFGLFAAVSLVIMAVTFLVWFCLFRCLRRRSRKRLEEQGWGEKDEATMV